MPTLDEVRERYPNTPSEAMLRALLAYERERGKGEG